MSYMKALIYDIQILIWYFDKCICLTQQIE